VTVSYRQAASDDVVRQFRYYLVAVNVPEVAIRFREAVRNTVQSLRQHPLVGARHPSTNPHLQNLRSWPVVRFESIRKGSGRSSAIPKIHSLKPSQGN
jgi:plasmid stabilization system protein ParE